MLLNFKSLDKFSLNSRLFTNFACDYSEDGQIFILAENGVYVITLKGYMESIFPRFSLRKDIIELTDTCLAENLDIDIKPLLNVIPRNELYELVLDVGLSGNNIPAVEFEAKPLFAMWSPRGIVQKTDCVLAVLTSLLDIGIYVKTIDENEIVNFICVANFSKYVSDHYRRVWKRVETFSAETKLQELKKRANFVTPTTFTWSHVVLKDRKAGCILFVGHKDGAISAWRFVERKNSDVNESKLEFLDRYNTSCKHITSLNWFCQKSDAGGLSVGDSDGRVCALSVSKLSTDKIEFRDEVMFNEDVDVKVDKITILTYQNITYLIAVKMNYLLIYAINEYGDVLQGKLVHVGNLYISGIVHYEKNIILALSYCGQLKQIELKVVNNELICTEKSIELDIDTNTYRTHGLLLSPNKVFLGILAFPCQVKSFGKPKQLISFFIFKNMSKDPLKVLMNMSANTLRDHWDCFETLRVSSIQEKKFPWEGIDSKLNYDNLCLVRLKALRWIAKMSEKIYTVVPRIPEYSIKSFKLLNYMVDIKLAVQRITKLLNFYFSEKKLTLFQLQSLDLLNFFLKEMVAMDILAKANLGAVFVDEIYEVMRIANEIDYPPPPQCVWCGEKIIGSSCVPCHADSRCAISLMPIKTVPGYKCPFCKCVVSKEMDREYYPIFCPYCDIPMERRYIDRKNKKDTSEQSKSVSVDSVITQLEEVVTSDCPADCLKEDMNANDIEDNKVEYVVLTDSEDEDNQKSVEELFKKLRKMVLVRSDPVEEDDLEDVKKEGVVDSNALEEEAPPEDMEAEDEDDPI